MVQGMDSRYKRNYSLGMRCEATILDERCILEAGHEDETEHESESFYWARMPEIRGRADQANPFARLRSVSVVTDLHR